MRNESSNASVERHGLFQRAAGAHAAGAHAVLHAVETMGLPAKGEERNVFTLASLTGTKCCYVTDIERAAVYRNWSRVTRIA